MSEANPEATVRGYWAAMRTDDWPADGAIEGLALTWSTVRDGRLAHQVEYWPEPFVPAPWRADLVELVAEDAPARPPSLADERR